MSAAKADKRLFKAAQALAKVEREAAPALAEAHRVADEARIEADAARAKVEATFHAARSAVNTNAARAEAADALARLATRPDLVDVLLRTDGAAVATPDAAALVRRKLMYAHKNLVRLTVYYPTNLGRDVARLAREIREKLATEGEA